MFRFPGQGWREVGLSRVMEPTGYGAEERAGDLAWSLGPADGGLPAPGEGLLPGTGREGGGWGVGGEARRAEVAGSASCSCAAEEAGGGGSL